MRSSGRWMVGPCPPAAHPHSVESHGTFLSPSLRVRGSARVISRVFQIIETLLISSPNSKDPKCEKCQRFCFSFLSQLCWLSIVGRSGKEGGHGSMSHNKNTGFAV
jgi:hypothetical protein